VVLAALAAAAGCKKEGEPAAGGMGGEPIAAASTDPLWAFAPADLRVGVVAADGVLEPLYRGGLMALAALDKAPGGAPLAAMIRQGARTPIGDVLDRATLDGFGIDLKKGMAFFEGETAKVAVLPVGDAAKFAGKLGAPLDKGVLRLGPMTCKEVSGRFLCADSEAALETAARGGGTSLAASWPRAMRGHLEVFVSPARLDADVPLGEPGGLRASAVFERGAVTARVHLVGKPTGPLAAAKSQKSALTAGVADKQPAGLFVVSAAGLWKLAQAQAASAPAAPLPGGVTSKDLIGAASGEAIGYVLPGAPLRGIAKLGLANPEPVKKLIAACGELAAGAPPGVTVKKNGEKCSVTIDPSAFGAAVPGVATLAFDVWVESGALVLGAGQYAAAANARPGLQPFAREILDGDWLFAAWGAGTPAGDPTIVDKAQFEAALKDQPMAGMVIWAVYHLSEFGIAARVADDGVHGLLRVRTLWANPDEVVAALEEKIAAFAGGDGSAAVAMAEIAKKYPGTPLARDVQAGVGGLMAPVALAGIVAAVSIPAFLKYRQRAESIEALTGTPDGTAANGAPDPAPAPVNE
jgi:hypothetical protein